MGFYQQISKYYDYIFPLSPATVIFHEHLFKDSGSTTILDVACGSGSYVKALADNGFDTYGIDLDPAMVEQSIKKNTSRQIRQGDMQRASEVFDKTFDGMLCIGNSIVHLNSEKDIESALHDFNCLLNPSGVISIQIVNYDRILDKNINGLPTLENAEASLTFKREYEKDGDRITFKTSLMVPEGVFENAIPLISLKKDALIKLLEKAGFTEMKTFGDFKGAPWDNDSYATIVTAIKG